MKIYRLLASLSLVCTLAAFSLEKPETADINPETKGIAKDISSIKTEEKVINTLETHTNKATQLINKGIATVKGWYKGASKADIIEFETLAASLKEKAAQIKSKLQDAQYDLKAEFKADLSKLGHELNQIGK